MHGERLFSGKGCGRPLGAKGVGMRGRNVKERAEWLEATMEEVLPI
ncbi:hypothetical protein [Rhizobium ruizarguesonis]|nr:hypothetical protein [Rhizobium ruizarguesonis]MBY5884000.1 hypothetical protein [Rhizobium leguminosarum]NEJ03118.1 hypothetical protein [Rhizobium ruizarguesonis]NEJ40234.1 hypothetical protein [Rhizobium ruizarguesonis]